jgi:hypothetical protein
LSPVSGGDKWRESLHSIGCSFLSKGNFRSSGSSGKSSSLCAAPEKVFSYIKKEKLYHKLYPFIYLKSEILEEKCTKKIKIHDEKNNQNNLKCYLITIGVRERLKYFRKQIKNIPLHFTEDLGFNGKYINVIKIGEELYITYKDKFLEFSGGLIQTTLSRSIYSICLDNTFYYPMTNYEIGCYLSHISIWNKLIFSRAKNALVCEDRVIFYDNFMTL